MVRRGCPVPGRESRGRAPKRCARATPHILLYLGPLPPSRGVQRGPRTSVALQSPQLGALTRSFPSTAAYTPAGHTWAWEAAASAGRSRPVRRWVGSVSRVPVPYLDAESALQQ